MILFGTLIGKLLSPTLKCCYQRLEVIQESINESIGDLVSSEINNGTLTNNNDFLVNSDINDDNDINNPI